MKIGIDIDNTITSTRAILRDYCIKYNEEVVKRNLKINESGFATYNFFEWTHNEEMDFCNKYLEKICLNAPIKENAIEVIKKIKEKHYIYIITSRKKPYFSKPYELTKNFLDNHGIVYNELIVGCENKYDFCLKNNIDIMIDDEEENINQISKIIPVIVFDDIHNRMCKGKNIIKIDNWEHIEKIITDIENNREV